jgi:hypothetical protein
VKKKIAELAILPTSQLHRPVGDRWFYESVPVGVSLPEIVPEVVDTLHGESPGENSITKEGPPAELGPVVPVSLQDIQKAGDDEWAAWYL